MAEDFGKAFKAGLSLLSDCSPVTATLIPYLPQRPSGRSLQPPEVMLWRYLVNLKLTESQCVQIYSLLRTLIDGAFLPYPLTGKQFPEGGQRLAFHIYFANYLSKRSGLNLIAVRNQN